MYPYHDNMDKKEAVFKKAMIDPYKEMQDFISLKLSIPMNFFTHHWNSILWNLPLACLPKKLTYQSWMPVLSKLNSIEICNFQSMTLRKGSVWPLLFVLQSVCHYCCRILSFCLQVIHDIVNCSRFGTYCTIKQKRIRLGWQWQWREGPVYLHANMFWHKNVKESEKMMSMQIISNLSNAQLWRQQILR